jgi:ABC-type thiamine transport system substrate-binding protein
MYPVRSDVALPDSYRYAPRPETTLRLDADLIEANHKRWLENWVRVVVK